MYVFTLFLIAIAPFATGYSSGAPPDNEICTSLRPNHPGEPMNLKEIPYKISLRGVNRRVVRPGETITLSIRAQNGQKFKGFLVQGRKMGTEGPVGKFADGSSYQRINCLDIENSAATHMNNEEKTKVDVKFQVPDEVGDYSLMTTVVHSGKVYWVGHASNFTVHK